MNHLKTIENRHKSKRQSKFFVWIIACLLVVMVFSFSAQAMPKSAADLPQYVEVTVSADDTLWDIANRINHMYYANEMNRKQLIEHIRETNHLRSTVIWEGQSLKIATNLINEHE